MRRGARQRAPRFLDDRRASSARATPVIDYSMSTLAGRSAPDFRSPAADVPLFRRLSTKPCRSGAAARAAPHVKTGHSHIRTLAVSKAPSSGHLANAAPYPSMVSGIPVRRRVASGFIFGRLFGEFERPCGRIVGEMQDQMIVILIDGTRRQFGIADREALI
jgi:hypothetical protein